MTENVTAYIGLGANLGPARQHVGEAMQALDNLPRTAISTRSALYLTPPWGVTEQPDFINAVAAVTTTLGAHELLDELQQLEQRAGRQRDGKRWGPRVLDLDLLLYGDDCWTDARLTVPHPRMVERAFVLLPLAEIAPNLAVPGHGAVAGLLAQVDTQGCQRVAPETVRSAG